MSDPTPNVDPAEIDKFGGLANEWWDTGGAFKTLHDINPLRLFYIEQRVSLHGARVLDVGCGGGLLSEAMAARGARVLGIDLAGPNIEVAKDHAGMDLDIEYRRIGIEALAREMPASFDVVTCLELLEHVPEPDELVAACAAAARPGGTLFFSTINRNLKSFLLAIVGAEYILGLLPKGTHEYIKFVRPAELAGACRAAGLDVKDLTGLHFNPITQRYSLGGNVDVNYFVHALKEGNATHSPVAGH